MIRYPRNSLFKLIRCQPAISVFIKLGETISQHFNLVFWDAGGYQGQSCPLEVLGIYVTAHVLDHVAWQDQILIVLLPLALDPFMIESLL